MERYLIVSPHTDEDCMRVLQQIEATGYITRFDWGCKDGDHTGWVIVEATSKAEALMVVPTAQRAKAHVVKLTKFRPEDVREHKA
ncbi:MAG TPA: hypothetical protein VFG32_09410 [Bacteroidota bacterium]|nr:hypothetical protein [Bacteroidota bacterium]